MTSMTHTLNERPRCAVCGCLLNGDENRYGLCREHQDDLDEEDYEQRKAEAGEKEIKP